LRHHLLSDFLLPSFGGQTSEMDTGDFDALTFKAASFDALAFLLEEVSEENVDTLIRRVTIGTFMGCVPVGSRRHRRRSNL